PTSSCSMGIRSKTWRTLDGSWVSWPWVAGSPKKNCRKDSSLFRRRIKSSVSFCVHRGSGKLPHYPRKVDGTPSQSVPTDSFEAILGLFAISPEHSSTCKKPHSE